MWIPNFLRGRAPFAARAAQRPAAEIGTGDTELVMACALTFGLRARDLRLRFVEHCSRVAGLVERMAPRLGVEGEDLAVLRFAAHLHEIGMLAVPVELLETPRPLSTAELARVRSHAAVGAEMVQLAQSPRTARLIEHQYTDFVELRRTLPEGGADLLLAGILRVADVFDTLTHPRAYQRNLAPGLERRVLEEGEGSRFDPRAVRALLQVGPAG